MKQLIIAFSLLPYMAFADDDRIKTVQSMVHHWANFHNNRNVSHFEQAYGDRIYYYGQYDDKELFIRKKKSFLSKRTTQEIISPIEVTYYSSGTWKAEFTKRVKHKKKVEDHITYLLMVEKENGFEIIGESDYISDAKSSEVPNLGKVTDPDGGNGLLWSSLGILCLGTAGYYYYRRRKKSHIETTSYSDPNYFVKPNTTIENTTSTNEDLSYQKGKAFEDHITTRFHSSAFKLHEWQGDKFHKGRFAESNRNPDMVWELVSEYSARGKFAVECKYRSKYNNDIIEVAYPQQLEIYKNFGRKNRMPVFLVLGVGGQPDAPEELFVIPVDKIKRTRFSRAELGRYKKAKADGNFFYSVRDRRLG